MPVKNVKKAVAPKGKTTTKAVLPGDSPIIDFSITDKKFEPMPAGEYDFVVSSREITKSSKKGTPEIALTLVVDGGEFDGRKVWDHLYLLQSCKFRFDQFFAAADLDKPEGATSASDLLEAIEEGTKVSAIVSTDTEYNNNKVVKYV